MNKEEALIIINNAIAIFEPIPEEKWCIGDFARVSIDGTGQCCAVGHYTRHHSNNPEDYSYSNCADYMPATDNSPSPLRRAVNFFNPVNDIATVSNGDSPSFRQATPKQRTLACLNKILEDNAQ